MGISYELSRRSGVIGGPEKPLSELGRKGYLGFWCQRLAREVLRTKGKAKGEGLEVAELARRCAMVSEDVVVALKEMGVCEVRKRGGVSVSRRAVREWAANKGLSLEDPIDHGGFTERWEEPEDEDMEE